MAEENRSPIVRLGYRDWNQYSVFKSHLMLPFPYLRVIVKNFRDLTEVPITLPRLVERIDAHLWSIMSTQDTSTKFFKARGVPVPYLQDTTDPIGRVKDVNAYLLVMGDLKKFLARPHTIYLHSGFENGALKAASNIIKQAIREGLDARMVGFGSLLGNLKEWDDQNETVKKANAAQLLCLYMVGKEYMTEFTRAALESLVASRAVEGKVTLITSHMDPAAFQKRYGFELQAVPLKFEDEKITATVDDLLAYMKS